MAVELGKETYQQALWRICAGNDDELSISQVIDEARESDSPLHSHFEWDDGKAGEAYRRVQARRLIVGVRAVVTETDDVVRVPVYMRDPSKGAREQGYIPTTRVRSVEDYRRQSMVVELKRLESNALRAHGIAEYLGLQDATARILESLRELQAALASDEVAA